VRTLPVEFKPYVNGWWYAATIWLNAYFLLGIIGIFLPALIASGLLGPNETKIIALAAATISGLQSFLRCDARADRYHVAWRTINTERLKFEHELSFLAINMVMAGCKPEYAPVRAAMLALTERQFYLNGVQATAYRESVRALTEGHLWWRALWVPQTKLSRSPLSESYPFAQKFVLACDFLHLRKLFKALALKLDEFYHQPRRVLQGLGKETLLLAI
jgi:hypothetical protein